MTTVSTGANGAAPGDALDLAAVFAALPGVELVLAADAPRYTMLAATDGRLRATMTTREGTLGRPLFDVFPDANPANDAPSGVGNLRASLDTVLRTRAPHRMAVQRYDLQRPDGTWEERHWAPLNVPVLGPDGAVRYLIHQVEDVTEAVRLAAEGDRLRGAVAGSERARASAEAARDAGEAANAQLQDQALELELANQQLQDQAVELEAQADELRTTAAELEERTEAAERAAAALRASEGQLRTLADAIPTLAWTARADGFIDWYNARWYAYTGTTPADMEGWGWQSVHDPVALPAVLDRWRASIATGAAFEMTFPLRGADGALRPFLTRVAPVRDADGRVVRWFGTNADVSPEREARAAAERAQAAAERAQHAAEQANRAKAEFLATMSHELRTPLNAIGGYAELMEMGLRGPVTDAQRQDLGRIQQSQRHLVGLVNEVLDLAKVDAGELRVERAAVRAGDTVDAALALVRPQAAAKALSLAEACGGAADRPYVGDEPRVRQVLVNLLANAVKFTRPGGRVTVECALSDAPPAGAALEAGAPYVALRVEDTGVGIPAAQRERIFEPFTQAHGGANPYTRQAGGTGLGLAISRRLARLMGGDLTVESEEGAGSAFTLWLPTPERRARARPRGTATTAAGAAERAERQTPPMTPAVGEVPGLARVGEALLAEVRPVVRAWVARLRADPEILDAAARTDAELEGHAATLVTAVALALRTLGQPGGEPAALLRDGTAIMALVAERHGAQRARLGWPEAAVAREFTHLAEALDAAVRRLAAADAATTERTSTVVMHLLDQAARLSLGGYRLATGAAGGRRPALPPPA